MTKVTFGVAPSSFITNMCVKQNSLDHCDKYPLATKAVNDSFYVDDGLTGTDTVDGVNHLQWQLQSWFSLARFQLKKWNAFLR